MATAKNGDKVSIEFVGKLSDGTIFDSTKECLHEDCGCEPEPFEFTIGVDEVMPGLEEAVMGMAEGETKTVTVAAAKAYGERDEELLIEVKKGDLPENIVPNIGILLEIADEDEEGFVAEITEMTETHVILDANHPLAGENLTFEIELLKIG